MKKFGLVLVASLGLLALPGSAAAIDNCDYAGGGPAQVYASGGVTGGALLGACVNTGLPVDGGYVEVGQAGGGSYAVIDGSDANPANAAGYAGLSSAETGGRDTTCDGTDSGSGTNSGGCLYLKPLGLGAPVPLIACGNTSGPDYAAANRDGCSIP